MDNYTPFARLKERVAKLHSTFDTENDEREDPPHFRALKNFVLVELAGRGSESIDTRRSKRTNFERPDLGGVDASFSSRVLILQR